MYEISVATIDRSKRTPKPKSFEGSVQSEEERQQVHHEEPDEAESESNEVNPDQDRTNFGREDEIENFFAKTTTDSGNAECSDFDFDSLLIETDNTLVHTRKTVSKVPNRRQRGAKNPVKKLAGRTDLKDPVLIQNKTRHTSRDETNSSSRNTSKSNFSFLFSLSLSFVLIFII